MSDEEDPSNDLADDSDPFAIPEVTAHANRGYSKCGKQYSGSGKNSTVAKMNATKAANNCWREHGDY